ncbi:MAG: hypothetical protein WA709_37285 [Stellaceae bacterium]
MDLIFVGFFAMLALAIGLYAVCPQDGRVWWALAAAIVVLVIASKLLGDARIAAVLLALAEFAAVALVWLRGTPEAAAAGRKYLYSIIPAMACTLIALSLIGTGDEPLGPGLQKLVVCLLIVGCRQPPASPGRCPCCKLGRHTPSSWPGWNVYAD